MVPALGDSDLSARDPDAPRGLVVFPGPDRPGRRNLGWYAPFLITVALGAIVVVLVALVR
jgi:hypothetical protein